MNFQIGLIYRLDGKCYRYVGIDNDDTPPDAGVVDGEFATCQECCDDTELCECPPNPPVGVPDTLLGTYAGNPTFEIWGRTTQGFRCCCTFIGPPTSLVLPRGGGFQCNWFGSFWPVGDDGCTDFLAVPCDRVPEDEFCGGFGEVRYAHSLAIVCEAGQYVAYTYLGRYDERDPPGSQCGGSLAEIVRWLGPVSSDPRGSYTVDDDWMTNQVRSGICGGTFAPPISYSGIGSWTVS